jgi:hypothetical protein
MAVMTPTFFADAQAFRAWLDQHAASATEPCVSAGLTDREATVNALQSIRRTASRLTMSSSARVAALW